MSRDLLVSLPLLGTNADKEREEQTRSFKSHEIRRLWPLETELVGCCGFLHLFHVVVIVVIVVVLGKRDSKLSFFFSFFFSSSTKNKD